MPTPTTTRTPTNSRSARSSEAAAASRARVRLDWEGRAFEPGSPFDPRITPTIETSIDEVIDGAGPPVRLLRGDALDVARALSSEGLEGKVDLVYVDPPFATDRDWSIEARLDGPADGRVRRSVAYEDKLDVPAYLDMIAPRLDALARLLSPTATIWVHLDWRAAYLVRALLDEILGRDSFVNEIVWRRAPNLGRQATSQQFGRTLDTIVVYGGKNGQRAVLHPPTRLEPIDAAAIKWEPPDDGGRPFTTAPRGDYTDLSIAKLDAEGRVHRSRAGKVYIKYFLVKDAHGVWCRERRVDALWTDVPPLRHAAVGERTGFPTQKPRALLERIIRCATEPNAIVVDAFAGSGTTGEAAHALGRRAILGDRGDAAIATTRARLARAGAGVRIERCVPTTRLEPVLPPHSDPAPHRGGDSRWAYLEIHDTPALPAGRGPGGGVDDCGASASTSRRVDVRVTRVDPARVRVLLVAPSEPLAWAIDPAFASDRPFHAAWHSERVPGVKPRAALHEAVIEAPEGRAIGVRVYADDGACSTREVRA